MPPDWFSSEVPDHDFFELVEGFDTHTVVEFRVKWVVLDVVLLRDLVKVELIVGFFRV